MNGFNNANNNAKVNGLAHYIRNQNMVNDLQSAQAAFEKKYAVNFDVVEIFSKSIQTGSVIDSLPISINTNQAERCFKAAVKPFVEGKKLFQNMSLFLLATQFGNSKINFLPKEVLNLIGIDLFQIQIQEAQKFSFENFCTNQFSYRTQLSLKVIDANDTIKEFCNIKV